MYNGTCWAFGVAVLRRGMDGDGVGFWGFDGCGRNRGVSTAIRTVRGEWPAGEAWQVAQKSGVTEIEITFHNGQRRTLFLCGYSAIAISDLCKCPSEWSVLEQKDLRSHANALKTSAMMGAGGLSWSDPGAIW